ncbi:MAG: Rieske (2Fe-2S) protein [Actinomycetota bacterium]|nr:Rieske (2Fe-2S) protein [Actinomycetota bacterium]
MSSADSPLSLGRRLTRSQGWLDGVAERLQPPIGQAVRGRPWLHNLLDGTWLGAPLHPALTDVPVGAWTTAFALDAVSTVTGSRQARAAADGALAVGIAGAVPAALTGASDWQDLTGESRRIGTLHGLLNTVGLTLNVASLACRRQNDRGKGRALSALALAISGTAAHLGGELSFGLGVRVNQTFAGAQPTEFTTVSDQGSPPLEAGGLRRVELDGTAVLLARAQSGRLCAIANTCSHLGGPLDEGTREGDVVTCPWHGSRFDICTGRVIEGPAVFAQPRYEVREQDGEILMRTASDL